MIGRILPIVRAISDSGAFIAHLDDCSPRLGRMLMAAVPFPFALPAIFSGMKIAMTMSIIGVIGEFVSVKADLCYYILYVSSRMETGVIFASLFVLRVIGVALSGAVALAEQLMCRSDGRR